MTRVRRIETARGWRADTRRRDLLAQPAAVPAGDGAAMEVAIRLLCEGMLAEMRDLADEADLRANLFDAGSESGLYRVKIAALRDVAALLRDGADRMGAASRTEPLRVTTGAVRFVRKN